MNFRTFHFIYGIIPTPLTKSIIFQDGYCTTNQILYTIHIPCGYYPLVICYIAIENEPNLVSSLIYPLKNGNVPQLNVKHRGFPVKHRGFSVSDFLVRWISDIRYLKLIGSASSTGRAFGHGRSIVLNVIVFLVNYSELLKLNDFNEMSVPAARTQLLKLTNVASSLCLAS